MFYLNLKSSLLSKLAGSRQKMHLQKCNISQDHYKHLSFVALHSDFSIFLFLPWVFWHQHLHSFHVNSSGIQLVTCFGTSQLLLSFKLWIANKVPVSVVIC